MSSRKRFPLDIVRREIVHESCYFNHLHKSLRFLIAQQEDLGVLNNYLSHYDINRLQGISKLLDQKMTILATDYFEICGVAIGSLIKVQGLEECEGKDVLFLELVQVYPEYEKDSLIERQLLLESFKRARNSKIRHVLYNFQDLKSMDVAKKLGMKTSNNLTVHMKCDNLMFIDLAKIEDSLTAEPQLPDAYKLKPAQRRCLKRFKSKRLNRELLVEIALPEDEDVFRHYMFNEFMQQTPVSKTLQLSEAELTEHFNYRMSSDLLSRGFYLMVTDQGRICAAGTCKPIYEPLGNRLKREVTIPMDLTEAADKLPFSTQKARQAKAVENWVVDFVVQFLPSDCDRYIRLEMLTIHPYYTRCGIISNLTETTDKLIQEKGFKYFQSMFLANVFARQVGESYPPIMIRFPYSQFQYKGRQIIKDGIVADGGTHTTLNFGMVKPVLAESNDLPKSKY